MKNKNTVWYIVLIVVVVGIGIYFLNRPTYLQPGTGMTTSYNPATQGKIVFGITDAALNMTGVSSVLVTVDKVELHSIVNGWLTVSSETKQYDLLALKKASAVSLLATANVDVGNYDQVRLMVSKVVVVKNGVSQEAKLPSGELKIVGNVVVNADKTLSVVFDFLADKSLHTTGNGKLVFAPVVKVKKTTNVSVALKSNNEVSIAGGDNETDQSVGMDEKGNVKDNFELKANLKINSNDDVELEGGDNSGQSGDNNSNDGNGDSQSSSDNQKNNNFVFNFSQNNNSGMTGTATLTSGDNGNVKVALSLNSNITSNEPAHIHLGSCPDVGGVKYPLSPVVNGKSVTTLKNVTIANLKAGLPLAINVHKSAAEISFYVACTDLSF